MDALGRFQSREGLGRKTAIRGMSLTKIIQVVNLSRNFQQARLREFADNDPAVIERLVQETKDALEATNR